MSAFRPTRQLDNVGPHSGRGPANLPNSTSSTVVQLPSDWSDDQTFTTWMARGGRVWIRFGTDNSVTVDDAQTSTISSNVITLGGNEPHMDIPNDAAWRDKIPSTFTHFAYKCEASGVTLRVIPDTAETH